MTHGPLRVVVADDDPEDRALILWELRRQIGDTELVEVANLEQLVDAMKEGADLMITERRLAWADGLEILDEVRRLRPSMPVIMHTAAIDPEHAVTGMRRGLDDVVRKSATGSTRLGTAARVVLDRRIDRLATEAAEQRYRALFERVPVGLYRYDPAGTLIECNQALLDILRARDIDEARRYGFPRSTYVDPEDRGRWRAAIWQNEHVIGFEYRIRRVSGDVAWIRHSARLVRDDSDEPLWFEGVIEDVTRSREAQDELAETERRFRALVEHNSDLIFVLGPADTVEYASPSAARALGCEPDELTGTALGDRMHDEDRRSFEDRLARAVREPGGDVTASFRIRRAGGGWLHLEAVVTNRADDPAVRGVILNARDVTERARAEHALRDSEERYRRLVELSPDGIVVVRDGHILFANSALLRILGAESADQVVGRRVVEFVHPDYRELVRSRLRIQQEDGEPVPLIRERLLRVDGSVADVEVSGVPIVYEGGPASQAMLRDISDRARIEGENELRTRQQAAIADLGRAALREGPLSTILEVACTSVARALDAEIVSVLEFKPERDEFVLRAGVGWPSGVVGVTKVSRAGSPAGFTSESREPVVVEDLATETRFTPHPIMLAEGLVSMALVAIEGNDRLFGVLSAGCRTPRTFSPDDLTFLSALANTLDEVIQRKRAEDDLRRTLRQLRDLNEERQRLLGRLVVAQEEERHRLAGDIHDDPIQVMAAAAVRLDMVERAVLGTSEQQTVDKAAETVQQAIGRLRHLVFELRPPALDREGLVVAIRQYLDRMVDGTDLRFELHADLPSEPARETRAAIYRIVQEALTNVRKHACAAEVQVSLERQEGGVLARVSDDGVGFAPKVEQNESRPGHLGLQAMRERAEAMGGWWRVESYARNGATVEFWLPEVDEGEADERALG